MDKRRPHCDLEAIKVKVARLGAAAFAKTALDGGRAMGLTLSDMMAVIADIKRKT